LNQSFLVRWKSEIQLLAVVTVWGTNFVVMKLVLAVMNPNVMNVFRIMASGSVLAYVHHLRQRSTGEGFFDPMRRYPFEIIRIGVVGWFFYQMAFILGLDHTAAGSAAILMATLPLWTALLALAMRVERLNRIMWLGIFICISGTIIVVLSGSQKITLGSEYLLGNLIMLAAAFLWGANTVFTKSLVERVTPVGIAVLGLIVSFPLLCLVSIPYWGDVDWERVTWLTWLAIIFSGSMSTGIAIVFWNNAVKKMGASHTAAYQNMVPLVALVASFFVLGEDILVGQLVGGSLTIGGLIVMRRGRRHRTPEALQH